MSESSDEETASYRRIAKGALYQPPNQNQKKDAL